jgi:hypothetical protein
MSNRERQKKTWRDSLPFDMFLSAVPVLVVRQPISEFQQGLTNYPVFICICILLLAYSFIFFRFYFINIWLYSCLIL